MQSWHHVMEAECLRGYLEYAAILTLKDTRTNISPGPGFYFVQIFQQFGSRFEEGLWGQVIVCRTAYK